MKLPFDLYEQIIDASRSEGWNIQEDVRTFRSFCLVCRAWLYCTRKHLWRCVRLCRPSQTHALIDAIQQDPGLANLIVELDVSTSVPFDYRRMPQASCFLAFATLPARFKLTHLRTLRLCHLDLRLYPPKYYRCFAQFTTVTHLEIGWATFETVPDLLRLVWALQNLETLHVRNAIHIRQALAEDAQARFELFCKSRASRFCRNLRDVDILVCLYDANEDKPLVLPPGCLGCSVQRMRIEAASDGLKEWLTDPAATIQRFLSAVSGPNLAHLTIQLRLDFDTPTELPSLPDSRGPLIASISAHTHAKSLRTLTFDVSVGFSGVWTPKTSDTLKTSLHTVLFGLPQRRVVYDAGLPSLERFTLLVDSVGVEYHLRCVVMTEGETPTLQAIFDAEWENVGSSGRTPHSSRQCIYCRMLTSDSRQV
ncbi:hypothetical protein OH77DRAFT_1521256 [Trametes cingulata]|nr:hypothetical protein OH77DRAFT_1521256 [Trametes cingulata]